MESHAFVGLDCSGETFSLGVLTDGGESTVLNGLNPRRALREMPAHLAYLLENSGCKKTGVKAVGLTCGPGSFTGVRLGVTLAKTIALTASCEIASFDTLELLARGTARAFEGRGGTIAVALDARRKEIYSGLFHSSSWGDKDLQVLLPVDVRSPGPFRDELGQQDTLLALMGQGFAAYSELVPKDFRGPVFASRESAVPCMHLLCELTKDKWERGELLAYGQVEPNYHRKADIQVSGGKG